jgi:hypothetical protein
VHAVYNACNNDGALVDGILRDADQNLAAPIALVLVTTAAAAAIHRRRTPTSADRALVMEATAPTGTPEPLRVSP